MKTEEEILNRSIGLIDTTVDPEGYAEVVKATDTRFDAYLVTDDAEVYGYFYGQTNKQYFLIGE
ncbi:MAG: hypothetical protein WBP82_09900 [Leuconostoc mesenteroides]